MDLAQSTTALVISNEKLEGITKIAKAPEDSGLIIKGISETIENEAKEQKDGFPSVLLSTLGTS